MNKLWHVLHSKPNKEQFLASQLESRNIEFFFPHINVHPANPRSRKVRPYFPGYLFVHTDLTVNNTILFERIPGSSGLVFVGGEVGYIPENILHAIQRKVDEIDEAGGELFQEIKKGDHVKITAGPFEGYEALFDSRIGSSERVRILLTMLKGRNIPVETTVNNLTVTKATSLSR